MTELDAVVFDLDSTLCVSTQDDEAIHRAIFERTGIPAFFEPADLHAIDWSALPEAGSERAHYENMYRAVAREVGADPDHAPALAEATVEVMDPAAVAFREGAADALAYARDRYDLALLTNGSEDSQLPKVERLGVADCFETAVCCGPGTGIESKPHPEPFERALDALGTAPERTAYVGDRHDGDVVGAHAAGMRSVWVPTGVPGRDHPEDPDPAPTHRLDGMNELVDIL
ncbi:HAD-superfamily hydrolase [Halosimplex carlsbadense 2-9-1]|uniref:HAD-superfamily hydrolase n=1 Tax=Halosimplex carlsbadense 2-9-1 TaxID=797114 RepID=M0CA79_9EURY|nr:HAD family hydrolase [Halosimplex carlsbadense]ELZ20201.1 HAD-superfamily hydrolase [Halosimplex carlsbadense 2-9-1]